MDVLFKDYCAVTDWSMSANPEHYFIGWNRAPRRSAKTVFVEYEDSTVDDFSYMKAVRAVANGKR